jgi:Peptidase family M23
MWLATLVWLSFSNAMFAVSFGLVAYVLTAASVLIGMWSTFGYGLRLVLVAFGIASFPIWIVRLSSMPLFSTGSSLEWVLVIISIPCLLLGGALLCLAFGHRSQMPKPIELAFPFGSGMYCVGQGGISETLNYHMAYKHMLYAIDFQKLGPLGFRASGMYPSDPTRYAIFGDVLYSPCDGKITAAHNDAPDFNPPDTDEKQALGNHVFLWTGEDKIVMAHLQHGSVLVQVGDQVRRSQPLARIGNSGNTTEPHLHIHAERGGAPDQIGSGECVPMRFDGRFLKRNDLIYRNKPPSA